MIFRPKTISTEHDETNSYETIFVSFFEYLHCYGFVEIERLRIGIRNIWHGLHAMKLHMSKYVQNTALIRNLLETWLKISCCGSQLAENAYYLIFKECAEIDNNLFKKMEKNCSFRFGYRR